MLISTGIELKSNTMKYSSANSSTLFCEQVSTVTSLFEKWNDCERTVVIYALLKRLRYPSLKFLQNSIDNNINQNVVLQNNMTTSDMNANNPQHLQNLVSAYKSIPGIEMSDIADKETYYVSDIFLKHENKVYGKKEDILSDILEMLPLLTPGNDEAKLMYLSLIPIAVEDTVRQIVSTELVQQIFSYLLIHPAISNEDRRSLSHWLRHLEDHIQSSFPSAGQQSLYVLSNNTDACLSNSTTSMSSSVGSLTSRNAWQAIAPPQSSNKNQQQTNTVIADKTEWNVPMPNISDNLCDNFSGIQLNELGSSQNSLGLNYNGTMAGAVGTCPFGSNNQLDNINLNNNNDDHHTSFSKNGTEIPDFELNTCDSCSCTQIGFPSVACDHYNRWSLDESKLSCMKTRRSNSLTTAMTSLTSTKTSATTVNDDFSNSSENLAQYVHKPRSFSLSIENPRVCLLSTGSDTRLDEIKPTYLKFTSHNSGMSNIGQWLKSLRLHKYIDIFKNITYEDMLGITEEYLQNLGVTKGASHKLALCIQKLHDRDNNLMKIEQDLIRGQIKANAVVEELANIVLTPMKPADSTSENVAFKFIRVLDLVSCTIMQKESFCVQDEENISVLLWILERTIHGEAFTTHMNQLKELKFKLSKLKISFAPKTHHQKSGSSNNTNKHRWNCKIRKTDQKNGSNDRINRKNSSDTMNFSFACTQQQQLITSRNTSSKGGGGSIAGCPEYKSSSYPNFMKGGNIPGQSFHQIKTPVNQQSMYIHQQQFGSSSPHQINHQHHRRSLNNLIVVSPGQGSVTTSISNVCLNNSAMTPKSHLSTVSDGNAKKQNVHSTRQRNQTIRTLTETEQTSNSGTKRPVDQSIAAVVLVSKKSNSELEEHNVEMNNNNVNLNRISKISGSTICTSTNSCASVLSKNICSAISSNFIINPNSTVLIGNADLKNNAISDITRLEQLEFLCLQMTEQAIN